MRIGSASILIQKLTPKYTNLLTCYSGIVIYTNDVNIYDNRKSPTQFTSITIKTNTIKFRQFFQIIHNITTTCCLLTKLHINVGYMCSLFLHWVGMTFIFRASFTVLLSTHLSHSLSLYRLRCLLWLLWVFDFILVVGLSLFYG